MPGKNAGVPVATKSICSELKSAALLPSFGILLLFCVYPFVMVDGYHDITSVRFLFFCSVSAAYALYAFADGFLLKKTNGASLTERILPLNSGSGGMLVLLAVAAFSTVCSDYPAAALLGDAGRYMGLLMIFCIVLTFFVTVGFFRLREAHLVLFACVGAAVSLFSLLQFFGVDLFGLLRAIPFESRINFLSPLGNINVYSEYLCLIAPFSMSLYCTKNRDAHGYLNLGLSAIAFLGLFCANSDSGYLGFAAIFFVLFLAACKDADSFDRYLELALVFFLCACGFGALCYVLHGPRGLSTVSEAAVQSVFPYVGAAVCLFFRFGLGRKRKTPGMLRILRWIGISAAVLAVVGLAASILYFSCWDRETELGALRKFLRFDDAWGTDRGYVWSRLWHLFANAPWVRKLIGYGPETVGFLMAENYKPDIKAMGYYMDNAHNLYLQLLITTGVSGLGAYLAVLISAVRDCVKNLSSPLGWALLTSILSYSAQAAVNITQPITTPLIFVLFAFVLSIRKRDQSVHNRTS